MHAPAPAGVLVGLGRCVCARAFSKNAGTVASRRPAGKPPMLFVPAGVSLSLTCWPFVEPILRFQSTDSTMFTMRRVGRRRRRSSTSHTARRAAPHQGASKGSVLAGRQTASDRRATAKWQRGLAAAAHITVLVTVFPHIAPQSHKTAGSRPAAHNSKRAGTVACEPLHRLLCAYQSLYRCLLRCGCL